MCWWFSKVFEMAQLQRINWQLGFVLLLTTMLAGCGNKRGLVPVTGRVTFEKQAPPKPGHLDFGPLESKEERPTRPGYARFDADGNFTVMSYQPGDGLMPGRYRINVYCVERDPQPVPGGLEAVTYVAPEYKAQEVEIVAGSNPVDLKIDVPLKKRK
jgi:hypothetical protein